MQAPEQAVSGFSTNYSRVYYNTPAAISVFSGQLAPLAGTAQNATYVCGQLLAVYTANPPTPGLVNQFVNFSEASANADQKVAVAVLVEPWVNTVGGDGNWYQITYLIPTLVLSGTQIAKANVPADITAFLTTFTPIQPAPGSLIGAAFNGVNDQLYILK